MNHFNYQGGALSAEDIPLARIADEVGTPCYCYSTAALSQRYGAFAGAFADQPVTICYALKANSNLAVVRTLVALGSGADVVSGGEIRQARAAGVPGSGIVFSGVGKSSAEMVFGLETGILQFNVESEPELETLNALAVARGRRAPVALRINPDVDSATHDKIATGHGGSKFGIDIARAPAVFARAASLPGIAPSGVAVHIGSQLTDLAPFETAFTRVADLVRKLRAAGLACDRVDLGGGLGIRYADETPPEPAAYAALVKRVFAELGCQLLLEPGRVLVADAGVLLTRILYLKKTTAKTFVIVDAAMNDLLRPALYGAHHAILPLKAAVEGAALAPVDVVGPVCESGDVFAEARPLPPLAQGDLLAIGSAGAYGAVMASTYNSRLPAAEVLVKGSRYAVVRERASLDDLLSVDRLPPWLAGRPAAVRRGAV